MTRILSLLPGALTYVTRVHATADPLGDASEISGISDATNVRATFVDILKEVLSYLGLIAVITIVIAGIILVVGMGSDESRTRAKNIILYTVIGLIVILLAQAIVGIVASFAPTTP